MQINYLEQIRPEIRKAIKEAMYLIRDLHGNCEIQEKENKYKPEGKLDYVSIADKKAQEIYVESIKTNFPEFGIIAEEDELKIECKNSENLYFTVDPLDGTSAYKRHQSSGIATMISLIQNDKVLASFIADVMTHEIYEYGDNNEVIRVRDYNYSNAVTLKSNNLSLSKESILLREHPDMYSLALQEIFATKNKLVKGIEVTGGSIGLMFARLWKGEVGSIVLLAAKQAPWDINPVLGICERMGFKFLKIDNNEISEFNYLPSYEIEKVDFDLFVVHQDKINELKDIFGRAVLNLFKTPKF